ncbi:carbon-nitrogen hydrolase family protein [Flexithrix dorotheae]|uniref:carbon-nitrogen hydrolase family protein n=1 Tax=Flexithrix dorotheae TaxID=70993 RepID=UPI0003A57687|nr:carbon-nitrogen hydrolase family protein [Flexithrix dorotheae]
MKICVAQMHPEKGDISKNIDKHISFLQKILAFKPGAIFFPELSLTGYEPKLAKSLATTLHDEKLDIFQQISDSNKISIGLGLPLISKDGILISMIVFQPEIPRKSYAKQMLHEDEWPWFIPGKEQVLISIYNQKIAPAICYESLQQEHAEKAHKLGANVYLASVAKSKKGVEKAKIHFSKISQKYEIPVLMANCTGFCDNFESTGNSAIWNKEGKLIAQLSEKDEGILLFDTYTEKTTAI